MAFPIKNPARVAEIGAAVGLPPGKKMSVRNLARLKPGRGSRVARPKPGATDKNDF
jgi:hypothetical protein